jgi:hypothetical protein
MIKEKDIARVEPVRVGESAVSPRREVDCR